eukprot:CAMPEP_0202693150 /NCGR_PEP_ID=MMETSP1385-20130828/7347_1 /ASSEMBLY_ACC=CAM_ASM_000861 /TAXON_ID=933848 /ORGANISM="Elphidium margaritaceum" /LENGTH=797 /DNA_ID=CAMNT_0049348795 /DNA_START=19 /DNA_END=2412 /DNA_ORIENTATION=-
MSRYTQLDSHKVREGWLWKKGVYNTKHKRRYFVLFDDRSVDYYASKEDADKGRNKSKGTIYLTQIKRVELVLYEGDQQHPHLLPPSLQSSLQRTAFNGRPVSHSAIGDHAQLHLHQDHHKTSLSSITHSGFEEELPFLSYAGLPSVSEQDESLAADKQFSVSRSRMSDVPSIIDRHSAERETKINMNDAQNVDLNGWTMNGGTVISSVAPPADYAELQRTAQKFEDERKEFTKSLLDLSKCTLTPASSNTVEPRPPTPNHTKNKKRAHSSFAFSEQKQQTPYISSSTTSTIPSHANPSSHPPLKLRRSPSCPSLLDRSTKLSPSSSTVSLLQPPHQSSRLYKQAHKSSADSTTSDVVECVLTDADADTDEPEPEESVSYLSKSVIASDIRKHHLKNRKTTGSTMSVSSVRSTSTMDSLDDACLLSARDEYEAFTAILKDTKLGLRSDRRYSFVLISKGRDFMLAAESSEQLKDWIVIFNKLCQGTPIYDGYFNNHAHRFFVLYQNKVLNCYKSQENLESIQDLDLRHILYLLFDQQQNKLQIAIPNADKAAENKLTLIAPNASIAREWYHKVLSMFNKREILKKIYDSAVHNIFISHNQKNLASCYVAMYKDYMVIFRNEEQFLSVVKMVFFNKRIFRDYVRKEQCTIIPINANVHVRKASKSHGKHAFVVSNGDRKWYFTVASKTILEAWLSRLKHFQVDRNGNKHAAHAQHLQVHHQHRTPVAVHHHQSKKTKHASRDVEIASSLQLRTTPASGAKPSNTEPISLNLDNKSSGDSVKTVESVSGDSVTDSSLKSL